MDSVKGRGVGEAQWDLQGLCSFSYTRVKWRLCYCIIRRHRGRDADPLVSSRLVSDHDCSLFLSSALGDSGMFLLRITQRFDSPAYNVPFPMCVLIGSSQQISEVFTIVPSLTPALCPKRGRGRTFKENPQPGNGTAPVTGITNGAWH